MKTAMARRMALLGIAILAAGCGTLHPAFIVEPANPKFGYDVPQSGPQPRRDVVMAIVRPVAAPSTTILGMGSMGVGSSMGEVPTVATLMLGMSPRTTGMMMTEPQVRQRISAALQQASESAKVDLEKIFVAKGMRTMGPFANIMEMTFSQKRDATFALAPEIHLILEQSGTDEGTLSVGGWFSLILIEPLSGQKIWVKKLEQDTRRASYAARTETKFVGLGLQQVTTDDRARVGSELLSQFYRDVMDRIWKHADPEEFLSLLPQVQELKARAAPGMTPPTMR